ncbi:MAG: hypothetical protein PHW00_00995 [Clostridia bacterium]|nr:hypothetical protein [Clostridia bacterium]
MINDIIEQVVDAEREAQQMIDKAQQKGYQIVLNARTQAEYEMEQSNACAKQYLNNQRKVAMQYSNDKAQEYVASKTQEAEQFVSHCASNIDKAIDIILENLM